MLDPKHRFRVFKHSIKVDFIVDNQEQKNKHIKCMVSHVTIKKNRYK